MAFFTARSIESFDMFSWRAEMIAARSRAFIAGSGAPILAATVISRASLLNSFDFWASCRPLRCMMFLNWECPAMRSLFGIRSGWDDGKRGVIGWWRVEIKDLGSFWYVGTGRCGGRRQLLIMISCPNANMTASLQSSTERPHGARFVSKAP